MRLPAANLKIKEETMKKIAHFRRPLIAFLCVALVTATAFAASGTKNIAVTYKNIKLNIDGVEVTPKDANGATVEPFVYNGTTYLPVRAVGSALGKQVSWDGNTNTVYIGTNLGQNVFLMDVCPPYETHYATIGSVTMSGQSYSHGFKIDESESAYAYFNLNGNYSAMEFDFGAKDGYNEYEMVYEIYLDGQLVKTITHEAGDMVEHYTIPLNQALQMKIVGTTNSSGACGFANITVQ